MTGKEAGCSFFFSDSRGKFAASDYNIAENIALTFAHSAIAPLQSWTVERWSEKLVRDVRGREGEEEEEDKIQESIFAVRFQAGVGVQLQGENGPSARQCNIQGGKKPYPYLSISHISASFDVQFH